MKAFFTFRSHFEFVYILAILLAIIFVFSYIGMAQDADAETQKAAIYNDKGEILYQDVPYNITAGARLINVIVDTSTLTITAKLESQQEGSLQLFLPRDLSDQMANPGQLAVFVDDEDSKFTETPKLCDYRMVAVNFTRGIGIIDIVGSFADSPYEPKPPAKLPVEAEGRSFDVTAYPYSAMCDLQFSKEQKKIEFAMRGNASTSGNFSINVPQELLGAPYTLFIDGKQVENNITSNTIDLNYTGGNKITILGTTAIPEFPSSVLVIGGILIIFTIVATGRLGVGNRRAPKSWT